MGDDERNELQRVQREIDSELRRVGVDMYEVHVGLSGPLSIGSQAASGGISGIGFDAMALLALLRELPSGAGTSVFMDRVKRDETIMLRGTRHTTDD